MAQSSSTVTVGEKSKLSEKRVTRRGYLKYIAAGVVVAGAAAGGYYFTRPSAPTGPTSTVTTASTSISTPTSTAVPVTLEMWTSFAGELQHEEELSNFAKRVNAKYPNITLKVTSYVGADFSPKLTTAMGAGAPPDLFGSYGGGQLKGLVDEGQIDDITDLLNEEWAKAIVPEYAKASHTFQGRNYALPYELNTCWLMINKTLFEKAGVEIPTKPWTWDEFMGVVGEFKSKGIYPLTVSGNTPRHMAYYLDYLIERIGGQEKFLNTLNREPGNSFTDAPFVDAFKKFKALVDAKAFFPGSSAYGYVDVIKSFGTGEAAMLCIYTWIVSQTLKDFPDVQLDILPFPIVPGGAGGPEISGYTQGWAVANKSKYKEEARKILTLYASPEETVEFEKATGNPSAFLIDTPAGTLNPISEKAKTLARAATKFVYRKETFMPPELGGKYTEVLSKVFYGKMTPEDACAELETKAEQLKNLGQLPM